MDTGVVMFVGLGVDVDLVPDVLFDSWLLA